MKFSLIIISSVSMIGCGGEWFVPHSDSAPNDGFDSSEMYQVIDPVCLDPESTIECPINDDGLVTIDEMAVAGDCTTASGQVFVSHIYTGTIDVSMPQLCEATDGVQINRINDLRRVDLPNLKRVHEHLLVDYNEGDAELDFGGLQRVYGPVSIFATRLLPKSFGSLERVDGHMSIRAIPNITTLSGFDALKSVGGDLRISGLDVSRDEIIAFVERVEVGGEIKIDGELWTPTD